MATQYETGTFLLLSFYLLMTFTAAAEESRPPLAPAQPEQTSSPTAKRITDKVARVGAHSCADRINQVSNFLTTDSRSGAIFFEPPSDPDNRLLSISLGLEMKGGQLAYVSETFAPNQANGCGGMYETVVYWEAGCAEVAKQQFSSFKPYGVIVNDIVVLDGGAGVRVFLMPAGTGCVAIKKEVLN
jgi:hypothetical protein